MSYTEFKAFLTKHTDKLLHFGVCAISTFAISLVSPTAGVSFTLGLALGKEYGDSKAVGNSWDWWDLMADAIGIVVGTGMALLTRCAIVK